MFASINQNQKVTQTQRIGPHLIQANEILQCSSAELIHVIEQEVAENPALEISAQEPAACANCASLGNSCPSCIFASRDNQSVEPPIKDFSIEPTISSLTNSITEWGSDMTPIYFQDGQELTTSELSEINPYDFIRNRSNLKDRILSLLHTETATEKEMAICEYLVGCLDDRGWLQIDEDEVREALGASQDEIDDAVQRIQSLDPPGIGARSLRECLILQLLALSEEGSGNELLLELVKNHWNDFVARRLSKLVRKTMKPIEEIEKAERFLRSHLTPCPADLYRDDWDYKPDHSIETIRPDVIIRKSQFGYEIDIAGPDIPVLNIDSYYNKIYELLRLGDEAKLSDEVREEKKQILEKFTIEEKDHIIRYVNRARIFIQNIVQRRKTIKHITEKLIESQQGYIETGSKRFLRPLTRTELAAKAGVHESTVSRALLRKYVQLPNQDVLTYDSFFSTAGPIKEQIAEIVLKEPQGKPYSDEKIRELLQEQGVTVARRTVLKYREELRIPSSHLRKRK